MTAARLVCASALVALVSCAPAPERPSVSEPLWFTDVTPATGVDTAQIGGGADVDWVIESVGCGGAWLDYDRDGDPDLYLAQGATNDAPRAGPPDRLYRNDGDGDGDGIPTFTDVTVAAGLGDTLWSFGVTTSDYDNDGDTDLYLTNWGPNRLYRNNGDGTFTDVGLEAGVADEGWGVSAGWADVDRDGDVDLFVANYVVFDFERYPPRGASGDRRTRPHVWKDLVVYYGPRGLEPGRDVYFRNDGDDDGDGIPTFTDATQQAGLRPREESYGLGVRFFDADDDSDPDLYVANDSLANGFFVNRGDGTFDERSIISGLAYNEQGHEQAGMGIAVGDYERDGRLDLMVTNFSHDHDTLYHNLGGGLFTDVSFNAGIGGVTYLTLGWGVSFGDLDHDGWEDLYVAHGHVYPQVDGVGLGTSFKQRNSLFHNTGDGRFVELTDRAGPGLSVVASSRAVLPVDLDGDGDLDLAVTNYNEPPHILRNDGAPGHWLQVRLEGTRSNRDGIGARVTIETEGIRQTRDVTTSASFAGSVLPLAHFGLAEVAQVERLEVRWPAGGTSVQRNVQADRIVLVRESENE